MPHTTLAALMVHVQAKTRRRGRTDSCPTWRSNESKRSATTFTGWGNKRIQVPGIVETRRNNKKRKSGTNPHRKESNAVLRRPVSEGTPSALFSFCKTEHGSLERFDDRAIAKAPLPATHSCLERARAPVVVLLVDGRCIRLDRDRAGIYISDSPLLIDRLPCTRPTLFLRTKRYYTWRHYTKRYHHHCTAVAPTGLLHSPFNSGSAVLRHSSASGASARCSALR